jgi:histone H3/H4
VPQRNPSEEPEVEPKEELNLSPSGDIEGDQDEGNLREDYEDEAPDENLDSILGNLQDIEPEELEIQNRFLEDDIADETMQDTTLLDTTAQGFETVASNKSNIKRKMVKVSKHGIQYPSLPAGVVKKLATTFARTSGNSKAKINKATLDAIMQATDWFFEQVSDDLAAYADHAGRKTIDESDIVTLMTRYYSPAKARLTCILTFLTDNARQMRPQRRFLWLRDIYLENFSKNFEWFLLPNSKRLDLWRAWTKMMTRIEGTAGYDLMTYDHSLFWRTRREISAGGFLTTIHNITDVAAARAYLGLLTGYRVLERICNIPCKNILCMIVSQVDFSCPSDWNASSFPIPRYQQIRLYKILANTTQTRLFKTYP